LLFSSSGKSQDVSLTTDGITLAAIQATTGAAPASSTWFSIGGMPSVGSLFTPSSGNAQSISLTLADATVAVTQTAKHNQAVSILLGDATVTSTQTVSHGQSIAVGLADAIVSATQTVSHGQSITVGLADAAVLINQADTGTGASQSVAILLADAALTTTQTVSHGQSVSLIADNVTVAASQSALNRQSVSLTLADITVAVSQAMPRPQSVAIALDSVVVSISQSNGTAVLTDTHDGWWAEQWRKKRRKKPLPDTVEEAQALVVEVIAKAKKKAIALPTAIVLPDNTAQQIAIAETLIDRLRALQDEDDIEALLLML